MRARTRLLPLLLLVFAGALLVAAPAGAQEETTSATEEILRRYDTAAVSEMAAAAEQNEARRDELEAEIEALEAEYDYGPERDELREELYEELPSEEDELDALASARLAAAAAADLPEPADEKAAELRRKAETADAVGRSLSTVNLTTMHENYTLFGRSPATKMSATYRKEAAALEVATESEEAAREEAEEAATPEEATEEETAAAGGGEARDEAAPEEAEPEEAEPEAGGGGPGIGQRVSGVFGDVNLVPILVFGLLVIGGLFALSRSAGMSVRGFLSPAMASVPKKKPAQKKPKTPKPKPEKAATRPAPEEPTPEPERRTRKKRPEIEEAATSAELAEWFELEAPEEKPGSKEEDDENPPD